MLYVLNITILVYLMYAVVVFCCPFQLDGPIFFASVPSSHQAQFNFTGPSGLLVRMAQRLVGFTPVKDY